VIVCIKERDNAASASIRVLRLLLPATQLNLPRGDVKSDTITNHSTTHTSAWLIVRDAAGGLVVARDAVAVMYGNCMCARV